MKREDLYPVVLRAGPQGWGKEMLEELRTFDGAVFVDGLGYQEDGTFREVAVYFDDEEAQRALLSAFAGRPGVTMTATRIG